eukprot:1030964-Lingulodinium_polyedra.AAC.1
MAVFGLKGMRVFNGGGCSLMLEDASNTCMHPMTTCIQDTHYLYMHVHDCSPICSRIFRTVPRMSRMHEQFMRACIMHARRCMARLTKQDLLLCRRHCLFSLRFSRSSKRARRRNGRRTDSGPIACSANPLWGLRRQSWCLRVERIVAFSVFCRVAARRSICTVVVARPGSLARQKPEFQPIAQNVGAPAIVRCGSQ